jgi:hypothetical protein
MTQTGSYKVLSPMGASTVGKSPIASPIPDLSGKTICAMRRIFRADETFPMIEKLLKERFKDIKFIPNWEMPEFRVATPADELAFARLLHEKECDVLLVGNAA